MCMMHAPINRKKINIHKLKNKEDKTKTSFNKELLKPDKTFVDERKVNLKEKDKNFFQKLFGL